MTVIYSMHSLSMQVYELDLSTIVPCCSGPKRPHDRVSISDMKADFTECLSNKLGFKVSLVIASVACVLRL